jgi:hypothetical protein
MKQQMIESKNQMIRTSLSTDKYWLQQEKSAQLIRNQYKTDLVELKTYPKFSRENPMKPVREHPHSWKLIPYGGKDGKMPIDKDAASKVSIPTLPFFLFVFSHTSLSPSLSLPLLPFPSLTPPPPTSRDLGREMSLQISALQN